MGQTIAVKALRAGVNFILLLTNESKFAAALGLALIQVTQITLVHGSMAEAPIVRAFVDNHSIFHIVASVRNYSHHGVGSGWVLPKVVLIESLSANEGSLGEEQPVHFIVHAVCVGVIGGPHSLFGHLTLVHVTRRLVVIAERDGVGYN